MSNHSTLPLSTNVCLVTVTYSDRFSYLCELIRRSFEVEGINRAIIVSNASVSPLQELENHWGERIRVIRLPVNTGSAQGYATGIQAALDQGAEYLWLMDDDNAPAQGSLAILRRELKTLSQSHGNDRTAVLGFRPDHQADIAMGVPPRLAIPPRSSFFGFHFLQIPYKLWRRTPWGRPKLNNADLPRKVLLPFAPYGGLLAHRSAFIRMGLPKTSLILYGDDTEYTWRLTSQGGQIVLVTDAILEDLESSWNLKGRYGNVFEGFLLGGGGLRAYYGSRNQAWFDLHFWAKSNIVYHINRALFLNILRLIARRKNANARLALLERAIADGEAGRLGEVPDFPL